MSERTPPAPFDTPPADETSASPPDPVPAADETFIDCPKCHAHNPPSRVACLTCDAKLLRGRTLGERIGYLIAGVAGAAVLSGLAYYLTQATLEGTQVPECCASPAYIGLAAVGWLVTALAFAFGPTPKYEQYVKRAERHQNISPPQALADLTTALELAPKKQKADILRRRSNLYVRMGRRLEGLDDLSEYTAASGAHAGANLASEVSGLPLGNFAEGAAKQKITSLQQSLVQEGELISIGYCRHCKGVTDVGERRRCSVCQHKVKDVRYVKPHERTGEEAKLQADRTRRLRRRLIGFAVAIIALVGAVLVCNYAGVFERRDRSSPSPTAVPTASGETTPSDGHAEPAAFATFDEDVFSFEYPSDWIRITDEDIPILLAGTLKGMSSDQARYIGGVYSGWIDDCSGCAQIVLVVLQEEAIQGTFTDEQYTAFREASEQRMGSRLLSHRYVVVGGLPGADSIHIGASQQTKLWDLIVVPPEPGLAYSVSCSAQKGEYDDFEALFAHAYETLRFAGVELTEEAPPQDEATSAAQATLSTGEPTPDVSGCLLGATFQADLSGPDGARFDAGESFTKTWRARNTGACPWGAGYRLTFVEGDQMGGPDWAPVPDTDAGDDAEISVDLAAPSQAGRYRAAWQICVAGGDCFGDRLTVVIEAVE